MMIFKDTRCGKDEVETKLSQNRHKKGFYN